MSAQQFEKGRDNQRLDLEGDLQYKLNNIINEIKSSPTDNPRRLYGEQIDGIIRKSATKAYDLGSDYVDTKLRFNGVTEDEINKEHQIINDQVTKYSDKFWRKVNDILHRNDTLLQDRDYSPRSPLNSNYIATSIATEIVTTSTALGTINKASIIDSLLPDTFDPIDIARIGPGLFALLALSDLKSPQPVGQQRVIKLVWNAILDKRVCPRCEALNGTTWNIDDPTKPIPGDPTTRFPQEIYQQYPELGVHMHPNCRCSYDIIIINI